MIFRPAVEWTAGATYNLAGTLTNADVDPSCAPPSVVIDLNFAVGPDPLAELTPPALSGVERVEQNLIISLESLACCPGVAPKLITDMCSGATNLDFDPAQCTSLEGNGLLVVDMTGTPSAPGAATGPAASQLYYTLSVDGAQNGPTALSFSYASDKPFCATLTAHSFATGETLPGPMACFGADSADVLGPHPIEPPDTFTCSLRQCEVSGATWDLDACTPLDPDHPNEPEPGKGCDCNAAAPPGLATLALAGLILLRRRRRHSNPVVIPAPLHPTRACHADARGGGPPDRNRPSW
jgi:MYXO-CTERM domain-containing protein